MRVIRFSESTGSLKIKVDSTDDLWAVQRIIFANDFVKSESERKFKPSEGDEGEFKKVIITLKVEKTEFDKISQTLRVMGKITEGKPIEFVRLNSYHTINIEPGMAFEIIKKEWHSYVRDVIRNAITDSKKPRLGIIVVDDEKALSAYLLGYGIDFRSEIYSKLSKRMSQKEFQEQEKKYFDKIFDIVKNMSVDTVIIAGPGFTKEDIKNYGNREGVIPKLGKTLIFESVSNPERSGVYELIKSDKVAKLLEKERIRTEFKLMEEFLTGLGPGLSKQGVEEVSRALEEHRTNTILVNDNTLGDPKFQEVLAKAEEKGVKIEVINSSDEVGIQLHYFKDIVSL